MNKRAIVGDVKEEAFAILFSIRKTTTFTLMASPDLEVADGSRRLFSQVLGKVKYLLRQCQSVV